MKLKTASVLMFLLLTLPSIVLAYSEYCVGGNLIDGQTTEFQIEAENQTSFWSYFEINGKDTDLLSGQKELGDFTFESDGYHRAQHTFNQSIPVTFYRYPNSNVEDKVNFKLKVFQKDQIVMDVIGFCFKTFEDAKLFFTNCSNRQKQDLNIDECKF